MKRLAGVAVPLALVAMLTVGVGASLGRPLERAASPQAPPTGDPIVIGAVVGFTGFMNPFDVPAYNAARLAVEDINKKGGVLGRPLRLISADGKSDKVQAGTAAVQLLSKGARFIIAPCDFDFGAAAAIEAQKRKIVGMSNCAGTVQFGVQGIGPYAYTMGNSAAGYLSASAEWAHRIKGWRTAYVLQDDSIEYHKQGCRAFVAKWKSLAGARVVKYDHFQQADPSIAAQITRIKSTRPAPDFIVECSHPPGAITALRQIRAAGVDLPIIGEGQSFDGEFWKASVPGLSNFYYASNGSISGDDPRPLVNSILKRLNARFGTKASGSTFLTGYSVVQAFAIAARLAKSDEGPKIQQALDRFRNVALVNGPTTFTRDLHISVKRRVALLEVRNGKTRFQRFWTPKSVPPLKSWVSG